MKHLSTSPTVCAIEKEAHTHFIQKQSALLRKIFEQYIEENRPNAPGGIFVPSYRDTAECYSPRLKQYAVSKFLEGHKWSHSWQDDFYISEDDAQEIIEIWRIKRPDIQVSWETIHLKTAKFLWWGGKSFSVKMWLIGWN